MRAESGKSGVRSVAVILRERSERGIYGEFPMGSHARPVAGCGRGVLCPGRFARLGRSSARERARRMTTVASSRRGANSFRQWRSG
jgi:hypothetical protein